MFKPGDIVVGTEHADYSITAEGVKCIVIAHHSTGKYGLTVRVPSWEDPYEEFSVAPWKFKGIDNVDICAKVAFMAKRFNERKV
jgi:hypothetical protein